MGAVLATFNTVAVFEEQIGMFKTFEVASFNIQGFSLLLTLAKKKNAACAMAP